MDRIRALVATTCTPDDRKTLAAVRSLGRAGATVFVGADRFLGQAAASKFVRGRVRYLHPAVDPRGFVAAIRTAAAREQLDVLLPMSDYALEAWVAEGEGRVAGIRTAVPPAAALAAARDKWRTLEIARTVGIETPRTFLPADEAELRAVALEIGYPCVIKLRRGAGAIGLRYAQCAQDLISFYSWQSDGSDSVFQYELPLIQEFIPGPICDVCALFRHGEPRAILTQRRLKTYPSNGGVGVEVATTEDGESKEAALALLSALKWHGPAQVELKIDDRDGKPKLIEVNGRFWGTLAASIAAGIDFPLLTARMAIAGDVEPVRHYQSGLRFRWPFPLGLLHSLDRTRSRSEPSAGNWKTRSDLVVSDPLPHLAELWYVLQRGWANGFRKRDRGRASF